MGPESMRRRRRWLPSAACEKNLPRPLLRKEGRAARAPFSPLPLRKVAGGVGEGAPATPCSEGAGVRGFRAPGRAGRKQRAATLPELLAAALVIAFIVGATAKLYSVGQGQQLLARSYSQAQTDLRTALRRVTRTIRHGFPLHGPTNPSTKSNFPANSTSNATQIVVPVPETDTDGSHKEIRIYYSNGALYAQRSDESAPGTLLISGLQTNPVGVEFKYYLTLPSSTGTITVDVSSNPAKATEAQISLTAVRQSATVSATAYVAIRNVLAGAF
jgi:Tfp pilus assembly protein PilW